MSSAPSRVILLAVGVRANKLSRGTAAEHIGHRTGEELDSERGLSVYFLKDENHVARSTLAA